jgi:hypothetical protein
MEYDPEEINLAIAQHFCEIIHNKLVGETTQKVNGHIMYSANLMNFRDRMAKDIGFFTKNIDPILKRYNKISEIPLIADLFIDGFVENYTFPKVFAKLNPTNKLLVMQRIVVNAYTSYVKFINKRDTRCFFKVELTDEQKQEFLNRFSQKIHHNGVIEKYKIYNTDNQTVPKKLFIKLRERYTLLEKELNSR